MRTLFVFASTRVGRGCGCCRGRGCGRCRGRGGRGGRGGCCGCGGRGRRGRRGGRGGRGGRGCGCDIGVVVVIGEVQHFSVIVIVVLVVVIRTVLPRPSGGSRGPSRLIGSIPRIWVVERIL